MESSQELKWTPIENMTSDEVADLCKKSKVYIDFGNHPGKDRFPREAAISGCCVITGNKGSAKYKEDVRIDNNYKFDDIEKNIPKIINEIKKCLEHYEIETLKFEDYRRYIESEEKIFEKDIVGIFVTK